MNGLYLLIQQLGNLKITYIIVGSTKAKLYYEAKFFVTIFTYLR